MRNFKAVFIKQLTSQLRNPGMLISAAAFIAMVVVMGLFIQAEDECETGTCVEAVVCAECEALEEERAALRGEVDMAGMFAVMFGGMVLISTAVALVQEDKTSNNLRFMAMAGVKPKQYVPATMLCLFLLGSICLVGFSLADGNFFDAAFLRFMALTLAGAVVSTLFGVAMGLSRQFAAVGGLFGLVLGMGPMFARFNDGLARFMRFFFTQQVNLGLSDLERPLSEMSENFIIIGINGLVILAFFAWLHRNGELKW